MLLADICKLKKMPELAKKIETYQPKPDPIAQKMQELEMAKIDAEIAKIRAEAQKILVDAGLLQAKTGTEAAKARNLHAETDKANLDFVEQESGTHHERARDLITAQAQAQGQNDHVKMGTELVKQQTAREKGQMELQKAAIALHTAKVTAKKKETA
jgi:hypothetical protein